MSFRIGSTEYNLRINHLKCPPKDQKETVAAGVTETLLKRNFSTLCVYELTTQADNILPKHVLPNETTSRYRLYRATFHVLIESSRLSSFPNHVKYCRIK